MNPLKTLFMIPPRPLILVLIPIVLSSVTHLWNPVGFPDLFYDEGVYMRRAMHVLAGMGPQESNNYYDHPFFGQIFLASIFKLISYPDIITGNDSGVSIRNLAYTLYLIPRMLMGILAVLDTFLIFKISDRMYGRNVAFLSSTLFAVMPMTWILRRILLDSIVLPFLLLSVLLALYSADSRTYGRKIASIALSGILMGISIFTKVPVFALIPLILYLILFKKGKSHGQNNLGKQPRSKLLIIWLVPVVLIPALWPLQSILSGNFDSWLNTVFWQAQRGDRIIGLSWIIGAFALIDPMLLILGAVGGIYAVLRRNWFIILWSTPYIVFLAAIGQTNYFHWSAILPAICIASAVVSLEGIQRISRSSKKTWRQVPLLAVLAILLIGLVSTVTIVSVDVSASQIDSLAYVKSYLESHHDSLDKRLTVISSPVYSWIFKYALHADNALDDYRDALYFPIKTPEWILIADSHYRIEMGFEPVLQQFYNQSKMVESYDSYPPDIGLPAYPQTNLTFTKEGDNVEIRIFKID